MEPGSVFARRYQIEELIGRGGMGRVFRARDLAGDRPVAIKVLHQIEDDEPDRAERFRREIGILARIQHPAVPAILDWGEQEGALYFVSELVNGVALRVETSRRGTWAPLDAASLAGKVAEALAAAHALGIVHRDVNANNIMITPTNAVRLLDFGIARSVGIDVTRITATGVVMGTPGYMSPEQFDARPVDERSDIYSLGVVLFELLAGRLPFDGQTPVAVALQHKTEPAPRIRTLRPDVPAWLERIVFRCLEKAPARRFATAVALARELGQARQGAAARRRRLPSGDYVLEDAAEQSDWALVLSTPREKTGWVSGIALRFEDRYYRLQQVNQPADRDGRWTYCFQPWPESDVFRGVVDYQQDIAERAAEDNQGLRARLGRWIGRK